MMESIESDQIRANIAKLEAETMKLNAEGAKLQKETRWFPVIWATAFVAAVLALSKYLH